MALTSLPAATARGVIPCAPELVYNALIVYDEWQEWLPSVKSGRLLTREGTLAIVELALNGRGDETLMLECIESPRNSVLVRVIEGNSPVHEIEWIVEAAEPGSARVSVTVRKSGGLHLINPVSWRVLSPAKCLAALRSWVMALNPGPEAVANGENLFELWETEDGLVCWIEGRKYKLTPVEDGEA
jgi:hypothetical protein